MRDAFLSQRFMILNERMSEAFALRHNPDPEIPRIEVDEAIRSIAGFYERTRNTLEYGEGDFLRQRAIERVIRRLRNFGSSRTAHDLAFDMVRELIRAGYFPNGTIPETVVVPIRDAIERLFTAFDSVGVLFHDELIHFAAFEIEDAIFPQRLPAQAATVSFVVDVCDEHLRWPQRAKNERGYRAFLFVAAHRAVLQASSARILHAFLRDALPAWREADAATIPSLAADFEQVITAAKVAIAHPRAEQYVKALRRFAPAFQALDDAVSLGAQSGESVLTSTLQLERRVEEAVAARIRDVKRRLRGAVVRATLYVFLTKMVVGLALELPFDYFVLKAPVLSDPFLINLMFPPALMFLVAFTARPPRQTVSNRIIDDAIRLATADGILEHAKLSRSRGPGRVVAYSIGLLATGSAALYFILKGLWALGFSVVSMAVFLIFLSVVSLFAWRVRKPLRDLAVVGSGGVIGTVVEILVFPFLALGRLLSDSIRSVNVFVFLIDVFIEAPLKFLFSVGEDWVAFLREKREELIEE